MIKLVLLFPVYNDWKALSLLLKQLKQNVHDLNEVLFVAVNDCSSMPVDRPLFNDTTIHIINLNRNIGHQKAIAVGLSYVADNFPNLRVIVMDSDGEDKPEDVKKLISCSDENPEKIIFAKRSKRQEALWFRWFYRLYKLIFSLLTGRHIAFGNYCIIPSNLIKKISYVSEIWNHFSGGIIRSKLPYIEIPVERGKRLDGKSKMNFTSLVLHGLSAISVHIDTVAVRMIIFTLSLIGFSAVIILTVIIIKFFTTLATPGWATTIVLGVLAIAINAFFLSLLLVFIVLNYRAQKLFIPAIHYKDFIENVFTNEPAEKILSV